MDQHEVEVAGRAEVAAAQAPDRRQREARHRAVVVREARGRLRPERPQRAVDERDERGTPRDPAATGPGEPGAGLEEGGPQVPDPDGARDLRLLLDRLLPPAGCPWVIG
ncbi:hypothetical protein GCM10025864_42660 [Luteimicrobium album]|uniref:Uncharacterized protein n=1 Tax=Luteimicrobium album TaxID=1054550 RepID=A0ABQ6I8I0_9MICO|nr:hypothetical protein GCM10025864_42660 [Luteimicrobium album]